TGFAQPGDIMRIDMSQSTPGGSTVGVQLDAAGTGSGGGGGATAAQIWSYANRTLTSGDNLDTLSADDLDARLPANFSHLQIDAEGRVESTGSGAGADAAEVWSYFVAPTGDAAVARIAAATGGASSASHRITVTVEDQ